MLVGLMSLCGPCRSGRRFAVMSRTVALCQSSSAEVKGIATLAGVLAAPQDALWPQFSAQENVKTCLQRISEYWRVRRSEEETVIVVVCKQLVVEDALR